MAAGRALPGRDPRHQGEPTVLDAAYNAEAAATTPVELTPTERRRPARRARTSRSCKSIDKALLESGLPTRAEDIVYVAIRPSEQSLYEPRQVVNLRDVVMDRSRPTSTADPTTVYVANAALDGARVEPDGQGDVNLPSLLQPRSAVASTRTSLPRPRTRGLSGARSQASPAAPARCPGTADGDRQNVRRSSYVDDFLIFMWLTNSGFYRGPSVIIEQSAGSTTRLAATCTTRRRRPTVARAPRRRRGLAQAVPRATALQASRSLSRDSPAARAAASPPPTSPPPTRPLRVSAATTKAASVAGAVGSASAGKSISSAPRQVQHRRAVERCSTGRQPRQLGLVLRLARQEHRQLVVLELWQQGHRRQLGRRLRRQRRRLE